MRQTILSISELSKTFGGVVASDDLSLDIEQGELHAIIGPNGAGKTTAIYMLTGVLQSSEGDSEVYRKSITHDTRMVQQNLGLCQQFNVLFELLTV